MPNQWTLSKELKFRLLGKQMNKVILKIDVSMRKTSSYSRKLTDKLINHLKSDTHWKVINRDLADGIPMIDEDWIKSNFTDVNNRTKKQIACLEASDRLVEELTVADIVIIGMPIYNFGVPAALKGWIDQIVRYKLTFKYADEGPVGLLHNKKAYIIAVSGGTQLGSKLDFISEYLKHILGFIGISEIIFIDSSGIGRDEEKVLSRAYAQIDQV